jgi:hypothetical protein
VLIFLVAWVFEISVRRGSGLLVGRDSALAPLQHKTTIAVFDRHPPRHSKPSLRRPEGAIFSGVCGELVH